jgi:hypothetical protein
LVDDCLDHVLGLFDITDLDFQGVTGEILRFSVKQTVATDLVTLSYQAFEDLSHASLAYKRGRNEERATNSNVGEFVQARGHLSS